MKTHITVSIDSELAHEAKALAARRGTSLSRLVGEKLEELVQLEKAYEAAMRKAIDDMGNAPALGFKKPASRDELHER